MIMKIKNTILILIFTVVLTACGRYKTYPTAEKITFVTETTAVTEVATEIKDTDIVYYTKSGKRYHYDNQCGKGTYFECTLNEAMDKGLTPCKKCTE